MISDFIAAQSTILYDSDEGTVIVPHTFEAAYYLGLGTKWCVAQHQYDFHLQNADNHPIFIFLTPDGKKTAVCNHKIYNANDDHLREYSGAIVTLRQALLDTLPEQRDVLDFLLTLKHDLKAREGRSNDQSVLIPYKVPELPAEFYDCKKYDAKKFHTMLAQSHSPEIFLSSLRFSPLFWDSPTIFGPMDAAMKHLENKLSARGVQQLPAAQIQHGPSYRGTYLSPQQEIS